MASLACPPWGATVNVGTFPPGEETFCFKTNEFVLYVGASGAGKTTTVGAHLVLCKHMLDSVNAEIVIVTESPDQKFFKEVLPKMELGSRLMGIEEFCGERLGQLEARASSNRHMMLIMDDVLVAANPKDRERIVAVLLQQTKRLQHSNLTLWLTVHGEIDKTVKSFAELKAMAKVVVYPLGTGAADINGLLQAANDAKFKLGPDLKEQLKLLAVRLRRKFQLINQADESDNKEEIAKFYKESYIVCSHSVIIIAKNNNALYDGLSLRQLRL